MCDTKIGVITSGIPYQYVKEALPEASVLKLGLVNPLPKKLIEEFASKVDTLYIVEELDPVIEEQVKGMGKICSRQRNTHRAGRIQCKSFKKSNFEENPDLDERHKYPEDLRFYVRAVRTEVYHVLNKLKMHAAGDIGCYTLGAVAPLSGRHNDVYGFQYFYASWNGKGKGQRLY